VKNETPANKPGEQDAPAYRNPHAPVAQTAQVKSLDGLYAAGQCIGRRRISYPQKDGPVRYSLSLAILTATGKLVVERWTDNPSPPECPRVGEHVCLPVTLQHFTTKNGTGSRLTWGDNSKGEEF
jgi:hypothetical protein